MRILTVEDDEVLAHTLAKVLNQQHYAVDIAPDGETGWKFAASTSYDLILLDVMLPKLDGVSLCRQLRQTGCQTPILLLTAKDSRTDKVLGLDAGADDYVVKPVDFDELTARIRAILRRGTADSAPLLTWAALLLDPGSLEVTYAGQPLHLTSTEHRLLELFLRHPQRVFSRSAIVEHLWAFGDQPETATIKTYIKNLRQKLKAVDVSADPIETVYGLGYRLKPEPDRSDSAASSASAELADSTTRVMLAVMQARESFRPQIAERLSLLQQAVAAMQAEVLGSELQAQALQEAHRFAGTLGTFGFGAASQIAEAVENLLQIQPLAAEQMQSIQQLVNRLAQELEDSLSSAAAFTPRALPQLLVVSDDRTWLQSLIDSVEKRSMSVQQISFPVETDWLQRILDPVQTGPPDAVLLDFDAAPESQVLSLLADLANQLAVPVLTIGQTDKFDRRLEVARRGGYKFLLKSTPADQLVEQILQTLQSVQLEASRILIVDDDLQMLAEIRNLLEPRAVQIKRLEHPHAFWQTLLSFNPDLLVLDADRDDVSGVDLCRVVRTDPTWDKLPVLALTSAHDPKTVHQLLAAGVDACVTKPIANAMLTRILNRLTRLRR